MLEQRPDPAEVKQIEVEPVEVEPIDVEAIEAEAVDAKPRSLQAVGGLFLLIVVGCGALTLLIANMIRPDSADVVDVANSVAPVTVIEATPGPTKPPAPIVLVATPDGGDYETTVLNNIYQEVNPSVVNVTVLSEMTAAHSRTPSAPPPGSLVPLSNGSGFVWDSNGYIVTNQHVVDGATIVQITFADGTMSLAEIVGEDVDSDLAVLRIDPTGYNLQPIRIGDAAELRVGMRVAAIGNPFGLDGTLTSGIISAIGRSIPSRSNFRIPGAIQTDAAINPGNSGGPLLNEVGEVIGVNAQIQSQTGTNSGVGFAIPIDIVERVVPSIIETGSYDHSYLGVSGNTFSPICSEDLELSPELRGALISQVFPRTPAARAGLRGGSRDAESSMYLCSMRAGGDFVTAINGEPITTFDDITVYLERFTSPDDTVTLSVLRDGEPLEIDVVLGARP